MVIADDLQAGQDRLQDIVEGLDEDQRASPSGAAGCTVPDLVLHLARSEEAAPASVLWRWRQARHAAVTALRAASPQASPAMADAPLKPATRHAELWAHRPDITGLPDITFPGTARRLRCRRFGSAGPGQGPWPGESASGGYSFRRIMRGEHHGRLPPVTRDSLAAGGG